LPGGAAGRRGPDVIAVPELPEVESTRRDLERDVIGRSVAAVVVRDRRLRWPVPAALGRKLAGRTITDIRRRAKYLLIGAENGTVLVHLGMSGSLRLHRVPTMPGPHDHIDLVLDDGRFVRYRDPRRFGCWLWTESDPTRHPLLVHLGPEPLGVDFDGAGLHRRLRGRTAPIKNMLMDSRIVAGVGNIYANEALFIAGIDPRRAAGRIGRRRIDRLVDALQDVLRVAVDAGGTTLRDYARADGASGEFSSRLNVYGREGEPCPRCAVPLARTNLGQRSTWYCRRCQR